jgi:uncharacterized protein (TIGR03437 family)
MSRFDFSKLPLAVLALATFAGTLHATAGLTTAPGAIALTCDTVLGPTPLPVVVSLIALATSGPVVVSAAAGTGAVNAVTVNSLTFPQTTASVAATPAAGTTVTLSMQPGCKNAAVGTSNVSITFTPPVSAGAITILATLTVTSTGSALAPSPSAVNLTCTRAGTLGSYTYTGSNTILNVTSPANGGTPFLVNTTAQTVNSVVETALPAWLTFSAAGTASATPVAVTITAAVGCGALPVGVTTYPVHLLNPPAADKIVNVNIELGTGATLTASAVSTLVYTENQTNPTYATATSTLSGGSPVFYTLDPTTLPLWLNATPIADLSPQTLTFTVTPGAATLALGSYTANVHLKVSGSLDTVIPVTLQVKDAAATLTVAEGITRNLTWTIGQSTPTLVITPISSDSPIAYNVTVSNTPGATALLPQVATTASIAYSFGSAPIPVTFLSSVFGVAAPGATLTGTVTFTPTNGSPTVVVTISVLIRSPGALITSISPAVIPTATTGTYTVILSGSGFVYSGGSSLVTKAGVVSAGSIVSDYFVVPTVVNSTSISVVITVPASNDPYLPFSGAGGTVTFGVCNPGGGNCSTPTSTFNLTIGVNPLVQTVTSASSYMQANAPALTPVSAYDILSVFGTNFCVSGGTGCVASNPVLYGTTDPVTSRYLQILSPDAAGATQRVLSVTFQTHAAAASIVAIGTAPLLFATNNQINLVVPDGVKAYIGSTVDMVVNFGYGSLPATMFHSAPYSVTIAAADPGVFTVGGDGQGDAAALSGAYALINNANPANSRLVAADSDVISLYVTGLGVPDSTTGSAAWPAGSTKCMTADNSSTGYYALVNTNPAGVPATLLTANDGLVMQSALFPSGNIQPCFLSSGDTGSNYPTVTIGGVNAPVQFAGWVAGSVAGLYQINVQIPINSSNFVNPANLSGITETASSVMQLPVVVTSHSNSAMSQSAGVNVYVVDSLLVTLAGANTASAGANSLASSVFTVNTGDGSGSYTYAITSGNTAAFTALGLALDASTGAVTDSGTLIQGTVTITVTATDTSSPFLTGSVTVTYTIGS